MTRKHTQRVGFRFDEDKGFAENCKTFLETLKSDDPEMAAILCENWDLLVAVVREGERDLTARSEFNSHVASALDSLLKLAEPQGGV